MGLSNERSRVRFLANHGGVRKGIRPQMLLCHTSIQVRRHALILENIKTSNTVVSHRVSQGIETINEHEFFYTFSTLNVQTVLGRCSWRYLIDSGRH